MSIEVTPPALLAPWATPQRLEIQSEARRFAHDEVMPMARKLDKHKADFTPEFIEKIAAQGYFGILVEKNQGGMGLGTFEYCMISEELARGWMSAASIIARGQGFGTEIGNEKRREELRRRSAAGDWIGGAGFSEPTAGSDLAGVMTSAVRDGDEWVITGTKRWIGFAKAADFIQVLCRVNDVGDGQSRAAGLANIVLEKERGTFPAGLRGTPIDKIGYHGFTTWELSFDGVRVPAENLIDAGPGTGSFKMVQTMLNRARVQTAARAVGLARAAVEDSIDYLQKREQFGHPISDFQALRFMVAEMAARVDQARAFYQQVAHLIDLGLPAQRESAMAKLLATEMAVEVTGQAIQLHGGNGYTTEHQVERYWRDARLTTIFEGTSQIQQKIIADRLLKPSNLG